MQLETEVAETNSLLLRSFAGAGAALMPSAAAAVWYFDPTRAAFFPACPLLTITGFACPGCGMTRGLHALMHGDILTALDFNALLPLVLIFFGYIFVSLLMFAVRGRLLMPAESSLKFLWIFLGLLIVFGVLRNLPFYPFSVLFP